MEKNVDGKVEISKKAFDPEKAVSATTVKLLLGTRCLGMTDGAFQSVFDWYCRLKTSCLVWMRKKAIGGVHDNIRTFDLGYNTIKDLSEAWADASDEATQFSVGDVLFRVFNGGVFHHQGEQWKLDMEAEFMEEHNLVYIENENMKDCLGCIARAATAAKDDIKGNVERKGKKKHKLLVSRRGPTMRIKKEDYKRDRRPKGTEFNETHIRHVEQIPEELKVKMESMKK
jgi:hypothetical protein